MKNNKSSILDEYDLIPVVRSFARFNTLCVCPGELKADINQTLAAFEHILLLYKSGLHLDNLPASIIRGKSLWNEGCF